MRDEIAGSSTVSRCGVLPAEDESLDGDAREPLDPQHVDGRFQRCRATHILRG